MQGAESNQSEVSQIRAQIAREHALAEQAARGLAVGTARHDFINRRIANTDSYFQRLVGLVGEAQAVATVAAIWEGDSPPESH